MSEEREARPPTLLFGGTFDPPHRQHVAMATAAADALGAPTILVVPAAINPQRQSARPPASGRDRLAMAAIAFRHEPRAEILDIEIARGGPSYTIDTIESLTARQPLRLLIGSDQALNLPTWRRWRDVVALAPPAIVVRPPETAAGLATTLGERMGERTELCRAWILPVPPVELSATHIRDQIRNQIRSQTRSERNEAGNPGEIDLDAEVLKYIRAHRLYVS